MKRIDGGGDGAREGPASRFEECSGEVWANGRWLDPLEATLPVGDPAVQFGLGVFETVAVREGRALEREEHLARLRACASRVGVPLPDPGDLGAAVEKAAAGVPDGFGWLRVVASRSGRCFVFSGPMDPAEEGRAATAALLPWRRGTRDALAGLKTLNYGASVLGLEEAGRRGADEGLWLNERGHLAEGCSSNLFVVRRRAVFTPGARDGILPGIVPASEADWPAEFLGLILAVKVVPGMEEAIAHIAAYGSCHTEETSAVPRHACRSPHVRRRRGAHACPCPPAPTMPG